MRYIILPMMFHVFLSLHTCSFLGVLNKVMFGVVFIISRLLNLRDVVLDCV